MPIGDVRLILVEVARGFDNPVLLVAAPDGGSDFIVEQSGRIVRADDGPHAVVLDVTDDVRFEGERGLLGLAIHPEFSTNALIYVNYIARSGDTVVDQFEMRDGVALSESRTEIIRIEQPAGNHNGGMMAFGPKGNLWIGMGDGGGRNDQFGHGQAADSLLGSMLRITVGAPGDDAYLIPPDNPFATDGGGRQEVWATGLRNPWRFAIDGAAVWIADVGQGQVEEVNVTDSATPGLNYGWSIMEGSECFGSDDCDREGLVVPRTEYPHTEGCSITGGVVYRGSSLVSLRGQFFYSDFCSGFLRSVSILGDEHDWSGHVGEIRRPTGFGAGSDGEMYIVTQGGSLFRIESEK
jgi:glucose/arabinose dehydrogenase